MRERFCHGMNIKEICTDGDDIVVREKPAEDVRRDGGYAEQIQDEEHDGVRGLIRKRSENCVFTTSARQTEYPHLTKYPCETFRSRRE
jgi:hypothetical protein